jgi:integrase
LDRLRKAIKIKYLDEITVRIADEFASNIAREVKPVTVNFYVRTLRAIFGVALKWKYIPSNPFREVKLPGFELPPPRILSKKELAKIFEVTKRDCPEYLQLFQFYLFTGLRRSEALRLEWADINEEANENKYLPNCQSNSLGRPRPAFYLVAGRTSWLNDMRSTPIGIP